MAKNDKLNKQRRRIAADIYSRLLAHERKKQTPGNELPLQGIAAFACNCADALIHEFDERGWQ